MRGKHRERKKLPVVATVRSAEHSTNTRTLRMTMPEYRQVVDEVLRKEQR